MKAQHETLNEAYARGWILSHWDGDVAVIEHDQFNYDLYIDVFGYIKRR